MGVPDIEKFNIQQMGGGGGGDLLQLEDIN